MSEYQPPNWRDAFRVYGKALRIIVEPAIVTVFMLALSVPWWGFILLLMIWLPLCRVRLRDLRREWAG